MDLFNALLDVACEKAREQREEAHHDGSSLDVRRASATVVTKLEEAIMWDDMRRRATSKHVPNASVDDQSNRF